MVLQLICICLCERMCTVIPPRRNIDELYINIHYTVYACNTSDYYDSIISHQPSSSCLFMRRTDTQY